MGRRVVWAAVLAGLLGYPSFAAAQDRQISGTVTRANGGQPLAEATITAVGGRGVARSNSEGKYTITVAPGDVRLSVRAIGYQRREAVVPAGQSTFDVALTEDIFKLEEVVVSGQSTVLEKRNATTATSTVSGSELTNAPAKSLEQALQGKVLGTTIGMNGGQPGGGGQIQIRGVTSILGNGQPLFVIDGVIISNDGFSSGANTITGAGGQTASSGGTTTIGGTQDAVVNRLADINPNEIESIEVLKSAAATAIYGSRATNGVVVIKTKRGTPGQTRFNFTQRLGVSEPLHLIGSRTWTSVAEIQNDPFGGHGGSMNSTAADDALAALFPTGVIPASANNDLQEQFYSNRKPAYETIGSVSGGTESLQYFVSAGNRQEVGIAPNTGARLQTLRTNVDQSWSKKFKTSLSLNLTRNVLNRGLSNNDNSFTSPIYNFGYTPSVLPLNTQDADGLYYDNPVFGGGNSSSNPFQTFQFLQISEDVFRQTGSLTQYYTPVTSDKNQIVFSVLGGFDRFQQAGKVFSPSFLQYEGGDGFFGRAAQSSIDALNYNVQLNGSWTYSPNSGMSFTTSAGGSYERQGTNEYRIRGRGIPPGLTVTNIQRAQQLDAFNNIQEFRDQALFANEQILALNNKLTINGGVRADRSSANGDVGKFYVFPRASGSYNFDNVAFFDNIKLRAGWGQTGNRPQFANRDILLPSVGTYAGQGTISTPSGLGNPNIRPETLTETEGGIDATLFGQRVQLEGTYYRRILTNQLLNPALSPSTGYTNTFINAGKLKNEGVEAGLTFVPINTTNMQWTSRVTFQKNRQRVVELPATVPPFNAPNSFGATFGRNRIAAGALTTAIWGTAPMTLDHSAFLPVGTVLSADPASFVLVDTIIGDANPNFQTFFNNSFTFRRLTLAFTVDWRDGGDVSNMTQVGIFDEGANSKDFTDQTTADKVRGATAQSVADAIAADPIYNNLGRFRYDQVGLDTRVIVQDGGFVRLRDVSLSYDAPASIAGSIGARSLRLNLQARNVAIWTKYKGFDPEFNNFGNQNLNRFIDLAPFPGARQFYVSVDLGF